MGVIKHIFTGTILSGGGYVHGCIAINVTPVPQKREGGGGVCVTSVFNEPTPTILGTISSGGGYVHGGIAIQFRSGLCRTSPPFWLQVHIQWGDAYISPQG